MRSGKTIKNYIPSKHQLNNYQSLTKIVSEPNGQALFKAVPIRYSWGDEATSVTGVWLKRECGYFIYGQQSLSIDLDAATRSCQAVIAACQSCWLLLFGWLYIVLIGNVLKESSNRFVNQLWLRTEFHWLYPTTQSSFKTVAQGRASSGINVRGKRFQLKLER